MSDANEFEAAITRALEQKPEIVVPMDFAARVRAALPAQPQVQARRSVGQIAAVSGAAVLLMGLCLLAPHVGHSFESMTFDLELLMMVELAGVVAWLGMRRSDG